MRFNHVLVHSCLHFFAVQGFVSKSRIRAKQSDHTLNERFNWQQTDKSDMDEILSNENDDQFSTRSSLLLNYLRERARPYQMPLIHMNFPVEVHVNIALYQIVDLDQRNNFATVSGYFDVWWVDPAIQWNITLFDNISKTFIPAKWIWKPEFYLYHGTQGRIVDYAPDAVAEVNSNGRLRMFIPINSRALCPINVKYFPFDTQNCTFACGSWSYQSEYVSLMVDQKEVFLGDFYDNQEWLLEDANLYNGTIKYLRTETYSTIYLELILRRQSFYYVFNYVFPTTLVSLVAVIGFHAPINATGRRESKFRLGIMTLLSMSVMLLMLVDEMKFALESIPGQRGSFSDVPLLGVFHMIQMLIISVATCTSSIFVHLEKYALRNQYIQAIPWWLRFLTAEKLFCCYVPNKFRFVRNEDIKRNHEVTTRFVSPSSDSFTFRDVVPAEVNMTECHQETAISEAVVDAPLPINTQRLELLVSLTREFIQMKEETQRRHMLPVYWERVIKRLEIISLTTYLFLITTNVAMLMCPELWY